MFQTHSNIPVVMTFSCSDPTGGAGIQADIETLFSWGCHCTAVITAITVQDTSNLKDYAPTPTSLVIEQARVILEDMPVAAFKIGVVGSIENLTAIHTLLIDYPEIPVVFNPIIPGEDIAINHNNEMVTAFTSLLCPLTTVLTPDIATAQLLTPGADTQDACAQKLMELGCEFVLIRNCNKSRPIITNTFYGNYRLLEEFSWERIPGNYHGCACTLTASLAGLLAHGLLPMDAVIEAQKYTWECIKQGYRVGSGSRLLNRLFWAHSISNT